MTLTPLILHYRTVLCGVPQSFACHRVPWPLFVQGSAPRHQLLEEFRASGNGVLLGAASFWEGVDVAGDALSVVVIDKLPFAAPDDPVLAARLNPAEERNRYVDADPQCSDRPQAGEEGA
jgi:Rad3-related DNA helicase